MSVIDWIIVLIYSLGIIGMSYAVGRKQKNQDDYYLGSKRVRPWQVGMSMAANQVSAISLIGVPAFIAAKAGGGLVWLQYELAIPLSMMVIIIFLVPLFRNTGGITIYHYLEVRFGSTTRSILSFMFLMSRSLATGVALLATSYVTSACVSIPLDAAIVIIGVISLVYTAMGGIRADIYSDIIQLAVLWASSFVVIGILLSYTGTDFHLSMLDAGRLNIFDFTSTGLGDGNTFAFFPMLIGGFFLYISYYGCDQSQAQRLLTTKTNAGANRSLVINSLVRFPLVITYSVIGILLIPFISMNPSFAIKAASGPPDMVMPVFFTSYVPAGLLGIIVAGIFAASMSSIDSAINSLSAATWDDFLVKLRPGLQDISDNKKVHLSRAITVLWGSFAVLFALVIAGRSETVIELVNKIGSAFYGPIAGTFLLGMLIKKAWQKPAVLGLVTGIAVNVLLWIFFERYISWMWWNAVGFFVTFSIGGLVSFLWRNPFPAGGSEPYGPVKAEVPVKYIITLAVWFAVLVVFCFGIERMLG